MTRRLPPATAVSVPVPVAHLRLAAVVVALVAGASPATARDLEVVGEWRVEDGLPQDSATSLAFDADGYLWIATYGGLARFDGLAFETYDVMGPGIGGGRTLALVADAERRPWVGTQGNGLLERVGEEFRVHAVDPDGARGSVKALALDGSTIWFGGSSFGRVRDGRVEVLARSPAGLLTSVVPLDEQRAVAVSERGFESWSDGGGWSLLRPGRFGHVLRTREGELWLPGEDGIHVGTDPRELTLVRAIEVDHHLRLLADVDGTPWGTLDDRLVRFPPVRDAEGKVVDCGLETVATLPHDDYYMALLPDAAGGLWAGRAYGGLQRLREPCFARVGAPEFREDPVWFLRSDGDDGVFAQVGSGELLHLDATGAVVESFASAPWRVTHLPLGERLLELGEEELRVLDADRSTLAVLPHSLGRIGCAVLDTDGVPWLGGTGAIARLVGDRLEPVALGGRLAPHEDGLVYDLCFADDGSAWFTTPSGLHHLAHGALRTWDATSGLPDAKVRAVHLRAGGDVWVTTYGGGICRVRGDEVRTYGLAQGLHCVYLGGVLESDDGRFFVNGNRGVQVFTPPEDDRRELYCTLLETGEGNQVGRVRTPDGRLWFPTMRGVVVVEPDAVDGGPPLPRARVTNVVVAGEPTARAERLRVPPDRRALEFEFLAPAFDQPRLVRYRYRLHGFEEEPTETRGRGRVSYHALPPGEYRFEVVAATADGRWNDVGDSVVLVLEPFVWETAPFRVGAVLLLGLALYAGHALRNRSIRRNNRRLQAQIDERDEADRRRLEAERRLREATRLESVGRLAGGIAHDFNNVLTIVLGHSAMLARRAERSNDASAKLHAEEIRSCASHAASLTRQLLDYSRRQTVDLERVDVDRAVRDVEGLLRLLLPEDVRLRLELADTGEVVLAEPSQLEQVIMNLVLNARDAMPEGGTLVVRTSTRTVERRADPDGPRPGRYCVLSVEDEGQGIDASELDTIFQPFYSTKGEGGTGLGLSSVRSIVEEFGGFVTVRSEVGHGSTFEVSLPVTARLHEPASSLEPATAPSLERLAGLRVLVCDDLDAARRTIAEMLERHGCEVRSTRDPREALRLVEEREIEVDVLVTDVVMPTLSGPELAHGLAECLPEVRVVYVSGYAADRVTVDAAPGTFLEKPFDEHQLTEAVAGVLVERP